MTLTDQMIADYPHYLKPERVEEFVGRLKRSHASDGEYGPVVRIEDTYDEENLYERKYFFKVYGSWVLEGWRRSEDETLNHLLEDGGVTYMPDGRRFSVNGDTKKEIFPGDPLWAEGEDEPHPAKV
jgi:hypothetical protein